LLQNKNLKRKVTVWLNRKRTKEARNPEKNLKGSEVVGRLQADF
jgi:hypothetical protein